jgi:hypothetical protein
MSLSTPVVGDLVKYEVEPRYTRQAQAVTLLTAPTVAAPQSVLGRIVTATGAEVAVASEANARGVVIESSLVTANGLTMPVLVRGPALVNRSLLKFTTSSAGSLNQANTIAALLANGIRVVTEPAVTTEQTS